MLPKSLFTAIVCLLLPINFTWAESCANYKKWGGFYSTCSDCFMSGNTLKATCNVNSSDHGEAKVITNKTSILTTKCGLGTVENDGGTLTCKGNADCTPYAKYGSFADSCDSCKISNGTLTASCEQPSGPSRAKRSLTNFYTCKEGTVKTENGYLTCTRPCSSNSTDTTCCQHGIDDLLYTCLSEQACKKKVHYKILTGVASTKCP